MSVTTANEATAGLAKKGQNEASGSGKMMSHPDVKIPSYIGQSITSLLVFIMAATMRGNSRLYKYLPKVHSILVSYFIHMRLNINGSCDVKKMSTHQTFH